MDNFTILQTGAAFRLLLWLIITEKCVILKAMLNAENCSPAEKFICYINFSHSEMI